MRTGCSISSLECLSSSSTCPAVLYASSTTTPSFSITIVSAALLSLGASSFFTTQSCCLGLITSLFMRFSVIIRVIALFVSKGISSVITVSRVTDVGR